MSGNPSVSKGTISIAVSSCVSEEDKIVNDILGSALQGFQDSVRIRSVGLPKESLHQQPVMKHSEIDVVTQRS